jgi:hypothetical protein
LLLAAAASAVPPAAAVWRRVLGGGGLIEIWVCGVGRRGRGVGLAPPPGALAGLWRPSRWPILSSPGSPESWLQGLHAGADQREGRRLPWRCLAVPAPIQHPGPCTRHFGVAPGHAALRSSSCELAIVIYIPLAVCHREGGSSHRSPLGLPTMGMGAIQWNFSASYLPETGSEKIEFSAPARA